MGKFPQFLTFICICFRTMTSVKSQWFFIKFDIFIDIVEMWFGIAHWRISSIFDRVICPQYDNGRILSFCALTFFYTPAIFNGGVYSNTAVLPIPHVRTYARYIPKLAFV